MTSPSGPARWEELRSAFDELVELDRAARADRLAAIGSSDPDARQLLEELLAADADAEARLASVERVLGTAGRPAAHDPALIGQTIGHFRILDALASGGMGVVYRAEDTRLGRQVALKFPLPDHRLDGHVRERFLREARAGGALDHPNLCSIYETGETGDGHLFIAMPLYDGETLRERIARVGALPVRDALSIATQVAHGLAAAHRAGIIHRDLKPANVMLLADRGLKILDFGLARVSDGTVTTARATVGTVSYMAPEQVLGEPLDGRTDLWSLGVLLYEMLTGRRPFVGDHEITIAHAVVHARPVRPSTLRPELDAGVDGLVQRLLAKKSADRYASADDVAVEIERLSRSDDRAAADARRPPAHADRLASASEPGVDPASAGSREASRRYISQRLRRARYVQWIPPVPRLVLILPAVVLLLGLIAITASTRGWAGSWLPRRAADAATLDHGLVAVLPFRVNGADPSLSYLREGMLDLLSARLAGDAGPRAVDARTLASAWRLRGGDDSADLSREASLELARELGAGRLVLGEVVSVPGRIVLTASLHDVMTTKSEIPVSVEGPPDSVLALVDRLAAGLLSVEAGERDRLASLMTTSLPALRLFLEGQSAYRGGFPDIALDRFSRAVELDSTFALASLMRWRARSRAGGGDPVAILAQAWPHRDRLARRDRAFLEAVVGPNWPGYSSGATLIAARQALVQQQPDDAHAWLLLGDLLPNAGPVLGIPDSIALRHAAHAYSRAVALDSTFFPALANLTGLLLVMGDTADARRHAARYLERAPAGLDADIVRCRSLALQGMAALPEIVARIDSVGGALAASCLRTFHARAETADLTAALADHLGRRIGEPEILRYNGRTLYLLARDRGRPREAERYLGALRRGGQLDSLELLVTHIRDGIHWNGDLGVAARAATALAEQLLQRPVDTRTESRADQPLCVLGQWYLARDDIAAAAPIIERLRALVGPRYSREEAAAARCWAVLATWHAVSTGAADAATRVARLDSVLSDFGVSFVRMDQEADLILARLLEATGDRRSAQRVLGRYPVAVSRGSGSTVLRERGRIAALLGDTVGAVHAYRRYLARRANPEPELLAESDHIRAELARLEGYSR